MRCASCGSESQRDGAAYCGASGRRLTPPDATETKPGRPSDSRQRGPHRRRIAVVLGSIVLSCLILLDLYSSSRGRDQTWFRIAAKSRPKHAASDQRLRTPALEPR